MTDRSEGTVKLCTLCKSRPRRVGKRLKLCQECSDMRHVCPCGSPKAFDARTCQPCYHDSKKGENHPSWKGGRQITKNGYVRVHQPDHPAAHQGSVLEHRLVMEQQLGRLLFPDESVHHKNGDRSDNRPENLELWSSYQPAGQRVEDKLQWAKEIISRYVVSPAVSGAGVKLKTIAIDFDNTLAQSLWTPENKTREIGPPIYENLAKAKQAVAAGLRVIIHTARGWEDADQIQSWCEEYGLPIMAVVCGKPLAVAYVDDRAVHSDDPDWIR